MKVNNSSTPSVYSRPGVRSTSTATRGTKAGAARSTDSASGSGEAKRPGGTTDAATVSLSPQARALASSSGVNEVKVSAIKAQVDAGEYVVDSHQVAEKMIDHR